jgi:hypothetical protein
MVEALQTAEVHIARIPAQFPAPNQIDQILLNLLIGELLRRLVVVLEEMEAVFSILSKPVDLDLVLKEYAEAAERFIGGYP